MAFFLNKNKIHNVMAPQSFRRVKQGEMFDIIQWKPTKCANFLLKEKLLP